MFLLWETGNIYKLRRAGSARSGVGDAHVEGWIASGDEVLIAGGMGLI
jgi:hypothetical protein